MGCCTECDFKGYVETDRFIGPFGWPEEEWTCPEESCQARNPVEEDGGEVPTPSAPLPTISDLCLTAALD